MTGDQANIQKHDNPGYTQPGAGRRGTVEVLHYADEGHKISKLVNRVDSFTRMAAFLDRVVRVTG